MLAENALFARNDLITNYPSEAPVLPEFDCSGKTYWNKKKGFKRDKKVAFKGLLYQAKRFNRDRNPEQWSTHESSGKNVWNIVGTCKKSTERKLEVVTMEEWNLSNAYIADNGIFFYTFLLLSGVLLIGIYGIMMHKGYCFGHHEEHLLPITGKCDDTDSEML